MLEWKDGASNVADLIKSHEDPKLEKLTYKRFGVYAPSVVSKGSADHIDLLYSICLESTKEKIEKLELTGKNPPWIGHYLIDYIKSNTLKNLSKEIRDVKFVDNGLNYGTFRRVNTAGMGALRLLASICVCCQLKKKPLKDFIEEFVTHCLENNLTENNNAFDRDNSADYEAAGITGYGDGRRLVEKIKNSLNIVDPKPNIPPSDFQPLLTDPPKRSDNQFFYFGNTFIETMGREKEESILNEFLEDNEKFCWLQIAGVAGQGKSRLAYDLAKRAKAKGWAAGFIAADELIALREHPKWQPHADHLIIVDYVIGNERALKGTFLALCKRHEKAKAEPGLDDPFRCKVRLLLLERQPWNEGFKFSQLSKPNGDDRFSSTVDMNADWFISLTSPVTSPNDGRNVTILNNRYRPQNGVLFITSLDYEKLSRLTEKIALSIPETKAKPFTPAMSDKIKTKLQSFDKEGRPLYAYFVAGALADGENLSTWSQTDVLDAALKRERRIWWASAYGGNAPVLKDNSCASQLAVLATMVGSLDCDKAYHQLHLLPDNPDENTRKQAMVLTGGYLADGIHDDNAHITGLQPDLLGEWFVLRKLENNEKLQTDLSKTAWSYEPEIMASFVQRVDQDFWGHNTVQNILDSVYIDGLDLSVLSKCVLALSYYYQMNKVFIPKKLIDALTIACDSNNTMAMLRLAWCYEDGNGIEQDLEKAIELFEKAAVLGNKNAMNILATCYARGAGVKQNWGKAIELFQQAAALGDAYAMTNLAVTYSIGLVVEKNEKKATELFEKAAALGSARAIANLGVHYEKGIGVDQCWKNALKLYQCAVKLDDEHAMFYLARYYAEGKEVEKDIGKAINLLKKSAKRRVREAIELLKEIKKNNPDLN